MGYHSVVKTIKKDELVRLLLAGFFVKECPARLQISYPTLLRYMKETSFLEELKVVSADVWGRVDAELKSSKTDFLQQAEEASEEALQSMRKLLQSSSEQIVFKAGQDLMDRDPRISRTRRLEGTGMGGSPVDVNVLIGAARVAREEDEFRNTKPVKVIEGEHTS